MYWRDRKCMDNFSRNILRSRPRGRLIAILKFIFKKSSYRSIQLAHDTRMIQRDDLL
jgi:hypothetical protein